MNRPAIEGVVETCLYVTDVARSRAFYADVFGFEAMGGDDRIAPLNVRQGQVLILFRREGTLKPVPLAGSFIPPHDGDGEQHFAFGIAADSFEDWKSYLEGLHIVIESVIDWPQGGRSLYFRDPDRLLVELITPGVWKNY
jgi:catechol 2,3-dioxygenase-like lactoylglutathione lyase family enzyme